MNSQYLAVENDRFEQVKEQYYARSADSVDTNRMTYDDVIVRTSVVFGFVAAAIFSWYMTLNSAFHLRFDFCRSYWRVHFGYELILSKLSLHRF